jgi:hypothetical protein
MRYFNTVFAEDSFVSVNTFVAKDVVNIIILLALVVMMYVWDAT